MQSFLAQLIAQARNLGASDIHLKTGAPPRLRLLGDICTQQTAPLTGRQIVSLYHLVDTDAHKDQRTMSAAGDNYHPNYKPDHAYTDPATGQRLRVNAYKTHTGPALAMRLIPDTIKTLDEIAAPDVIKYLASRPRGLILVTGPTGSGKSATLAAMIDHINGQQPKHILTIEDPIEYLHSEREAMISQREIGQHVRTYAAALKDALREDPDVILVGEMRDPETIRLALTAAETGHLVLSTLHTRSAAQSIDRIIDVFPAGEKETVRTMLANSLQGVIAQQLVRCVQQDRRCAAFEILVSTPAVRNNIRENTIAQINSIMATNLRAGMITLDQSLAALVSRNTITKSEAVRVANEPDKFQ